MVDTKNPEVFAINIDKAIENNDSLLNVIKSLEKKWAERSKVVSENAKKKEKAEQAKKNLLKASEEYLKTIGSDCKLSIDDNGNLSIVSGDVEKILNTFLKSTPSQNFCDCFSSSLYELLK